MDLQRGAGSRGGDRRARASSTSGSTPARWRGGLAAHRRGGRAVRPHRRRAQAPRVNVEFVSRQPHRAAARRARPPGRARRRDRDPARVDRLEGLARVLLQRRRRADREPRAAACRRGSRARGRARSRFPRAATTASTSARSRERTSRRIRTTRTGDDVDAVRALRRRRRCARSRTSTCRRSA